MKYAGIITDVERHFYEGANRAVREVLGDIGAFHGRKDWKRKEADIYESNTTNNPYNLFAYLETFRKLGSVIEE